LRDRVEELSARLAALEFRYSDPYKGFDRSAVRLLLAISACGKRGGGLRCFDRVAALFR
jgi:hypothetical protein